VLQQLLLAVQQPQLQYLLLVLTQVLLLCFRCHQQRMC
jgi:hypothetical protein